MRGVILVALASVIGTGTGSDAGSARAAEVWRVRTQLDSAFVDLASADVHALSAAQLARRAELQRVLRKYQARGEFPHNYDFAEPMPYFVDRNTGARCAVAFLMESSGRRDLVDRIAAANNNVWVAELAADTAVGAWLDANGLTLREAAIIQEPYGFETIVLEPPQARFTNIAAATAAVSSLSILANLSAEPGRGRWRYVVGLASGTVGLLTSSDAMRAVPDADRGIHRLNTAVSVVSLAIAAKGIVTHARLAGQAEQAARKAAAANQTRLTVTPVASLSDRSGGVTVALRF
jgi:hypothetical protein